MSLIALDMARQENNRYDILCCVRASKKDFAGSSFSSSSSSEPGSNSAGGEGFLYKVFKHLYAPFLMKVRNELRNYAGSILATFLMKEWVRPLVVVVFFGWFCSSMAVMPSVEVGLDQEITMPDESFVLKYFEFLKVGFKRS